MPLTILRTFDNYITANIVKARLEAEGIFCFLKDEHSAIMQWSLAVGGIKLQVGEQDEATADALLRQIDKEAQTENDMPVFWEEDTEQLNPENKICIHCGSNNTRQEGFEKIHQVLQSVFMDSHPKEWHCFHCGKKF